MDAGRRAFLRTGGRAALGCSLLPLASDPSGNLNDALRELEALVPALMKDAGVPGVSMAVITDGALRWRKGFGVRDTASGKPVDLETVFEAQSMSKPVFITARHVLCHTTGFQNWRSEKEPLAIHFTPGERYQYSGEGYSYLESVVTPPGRRAVRAVHEGQRARPVRHDLERVHLERRVRAPRGETARSARKAVRPAEEHGCRRRALRFGRRAADDADGLREVRHRSHRSETGRRAPAHDGRTERDDSSADQHERQVFELMGARLAGAAAWRDRPWRRHQRVPLVVKFARFNRGAA